jgi:hypothetical protein
MRERPVVVCLHGGPGFDHSTLKPHLAPLAEHDQLVSARSRHPGDLERIELGAPEDRLQLVGSAPVARAPGDVDLVAG